MRVPLLGTLPEEEWEKYQSELERKAGVTWNRVTFMERAWDVIRRYGTQSVMKVGLNQPIMREILGKLMSSTESDILTESVSEDSANENQVVRKLPVRRAKKGLKRLKGRTGSKIVNQKVVESKANAVSASVAKVARPNQSRQGDGAALAGGEKENLIPPMLLAGLTLTATKSKKNARMRLAWCLMGIKRSEYEANNDSKLKEQDLELIEALRVLISRDDSAIAWAKRKDAFWKNV